MTWGFIWLMFILKIPILAVLGNHDFEAGHPHEVATILEGAGVRMLDGECAEIGGVGFVGVCGFGGGFGARMLNAWGEPAIKHFVQEAVDQAMKLERALARVEARQRIAVLHYAPVRDTVEVNVSFYRPLTESMTRNWVQRTPEGFVFAVKLHQGFTHPAGVGPAAHDTPPVTFPPTRAVPPP